MSKTINYIDLCCGIGGFRLAIQEFEKRNKSHKFRCVFSADIKQDALDTYNLNFKENLIKNDIYDIEKLPAFDMLCCGFPCQPFSCSGNKKGFKDKRGGMIFKLLDLCKLYKPQTIILENVSNLLTLEKGEIIAKIQNIFEEIGYSISYRRLNSLDFGIPQSRNRVYIVGTLGKKIDLGEIKYSSIKTLKDVIEKSKKYTDIDKNFADKLLKLHEKESIYGCKLQDKRGGKKNIHSWDIGYNGIISKDERALMEKIMTERRKKHWAVKKGIKWMDGMPLTYDEIKTFNKDKNLQKMLDNLVEKKYLKLEKCKDLIDGKRQYKEDSEEGYNICKGKLSFPISKILDPDGTAPTLTATDSNKLVFIIDDKYVRRLTDMEIKRVCGFPEDYKIPENVNKYDLFGNMVTPPVVVKILERVF
ncbi:DNA (cytosine-5-)-methyltransferase [Aureispira]|nr:DNA (cytosine-5-)-methyltransferase [Aureispira sp.]